MKHGHSWEGAAHLSFFFYLGFVSTRLRFAPIRPESGRISQIGSYQPETETNRNRLKSALNHASEDSSESGYEVKVLKE